MTQVYLGSSDAERSALLARSRGGDMTVSNRELMEALHGAGAQ